MRPMSLFESGQSTAEVSLRALLDDEPQNGMNTTLTFEDLLQCLVIDGWPELNGSTEKRARLWVKDYLTLITEVDLPAIGTRHDPRNIQRLLGSLARSVGHPVSDNELARDTLGRAGPGHWGAFEAKLNPQAVDEGAQSLLRFAAHVDASRQGEPSCLGVIPSTGVAGRREDGVHVIPIGTLGP